MDDSWHTAPGIGVLNNLYIRLDGTSTTTAVIPFAEGIKIPDQKLIVFESGASAFDRPYIVYDSGVPYLAMFGGNAFVTDTKGGAVLCQGGTGSGLEEGGYVEITAGGGGLTGKGGDILITSGEGHGGSVNGDIALQTPNIGTTGSIWVSAFKGGVIVTTGADGITLNALTGFIRGTAGLLSAQATIDISADTNLSVTSPITLTGDTIGFDDTNFVLIDGTHALIADWDAGSHKIIAEQFESDIAFGTAPFIVASTTLVTNLNADMLDGKHVGTSGNTVPLLDGTNTWDDVNTFNDRVVVLEGPTGTTPTTSSVVINPRLATLGSALLWLGINNSLEAYVNDAGIIYAPALYLDATSTQIQIYVSANDLYIKNVTQDKDIIFNINDGGTTKDFMKIDASSPMLEIAAGTFAGSTATPIVYVHGDSVISTVGIVLRFVVTNNGAGTAYITYGEPSIGQATGGKITGHYLVARGVQGTSGTHLKVGYEADIDMPTMTGTIGGNFTDLGFDVDMSGLMIFPSNASGSNVIHEGIKISRSAYNVNNLLGGSINNLTSYGLYITGWGSVDTTTGVAGTFTNYAIYVDGGNCFLGSDNAKWIWGAGGDAGIYFDATDLIIDPDIVGSGIVKIGATADDTIDAGAYKVGGVAGTNFAGAITNITVVNGIVTAAS